MVRFPVFATTIAAIGLTVGTVFTVVKPASAEIITCSSNNLQRNNCRVDTRNGVRLIRQLSDSRCNGNWGYDRNRIWVRNGCRAEFLVGSRNDGRYGRYDRNDRYDRHHRCDRNRR